MQDAAGAWIKSKVSRAVLLGEEIRTVRQFFDYCQVHLIGEAPSARFCSHGKKQKFTAYRKFWLLDSAELARYRFTLPTLKTWSGIRADGVFAFWPVGDKVGHLARRWLACCCNACWEGCHSECEYKEFLTVDGNDYNEIKTEVPPFLILCHPKP